MPIFKVWDSKRRVRKSVVASNMDDLTEKGAQKLGLETIQTVVLEEDGTIVDDTEVLVEFQGKVLLLLQEGEEWTCVKDVKPQTSANNTDNEPKTPQARPKSPVPSTPTDCNLNHEVTPSVSEAPSTPITPVSSDATEIASALQKAPVPTFSPTVLRQLTVGPIQPLWNNMIAEAANYYYGNWPKVGDSQHYRIIGMAMLKEYPIIGMEGQNKWSFFTKSLSQKIRHIRHSLKVKSQSGPSPSEPAKRPCFRVLNMSATQNAVVPSEADIDRHVDELKKAWKSKNKSDDHIKMLLKQTRARRVKMLEEDPSGRIKPIFEEFPCFAESRFIMYEFSLMVGVERARNFALNMKMLCTAVESLACTEPTEGPLRMLPVIQFMEKETKFDRPTSKGKKGKTESILKVHKGVPDDNIEKTLESPEGTPLHVCVFLSEQEELCGLYLVGDAIYSKIDIRGGIITAVTKLMAAYYIFNVDYPREYAMLMGMLQIHVMEEPYRREKTKKFKFFDEKVRKEIRKLNKDNS